MDIDSVLIINNEPLKVEDLKSQLESSHTLVRVVTSPFEVGNELGKQTWSIVVLSFQLQSFQMMAHELLKAIDGKPTKLIVAGLKDSAEHITFCHDNNIKVSALEPSPDNLMSILGATASQSSDVPDGKGLRVLIVDDDEFIRNLISHRLNRFGFVTQLASGGEKVAGKMITFKPDIVLIDLMMPNMDGFAAIKYLEGVFSPLRAKDKSFRIVVMTGMDRLGDKNLAFFKDYDIPVIKKPVDVKLLTRQLIAINQERSAHIAAK